MNSNLIINLLLYFARFPSRQAILDIFNKGRSDIPGYEALKNIISAMPGDPVLPDIENFVFGPNLDAVKKRISQIAGYYLFVDYSNIASQVDKSNRIADTFTLAATIAYKTSEFAGDLIDQALISASTLDMLVKMRNQMIAEQREKISYRFISDKHSINPFISPEFESIGWTLMFEQSAPDIFNAKLSFLQH